MTRLILKPLNVYSRVWQNIRSVPLSMCSLVVTSRYREVQSVCFHSHSYYGNVHNYINTFTRNWNNSIAVTNNFFRPVWSTKGFNLLSEAYMSTGTQNQTSHEAQLLGILKKRFPDSEYLEVTDISGGCGSMLEIVVESAEFQGLSRVKQHMLVTEALKPIMKDLHGVRINTVVPEEDSL